MPQCACGVKGQFLRLDCHFDLVEARSLLFLLLSTQYNPGMLVPKVPVTFFFTSHVTLGVLGLLVNITVLAFLHRP